MEDNGAENSRDTREHLVVLKRNLLDAILRGDKTIECRLMKGRHAPFRKVGPGDTLFLKMSAGPVRGIARVAGVETLENLSSVKVRELERKYNDSILGPADYWRTKRHSRYGVLIWLTDVHEVASRQIDKRDRAPWVVLSKERCYGLL